LKKSGINAYGFGKDSWTFNYGEWKIHDGNVNACDVDGKRKWKWVAGAMDGWASTLLLPAYKLIIS
jgi:hypothetical protein